MGTAPKPLRHIGTREIRTKRLVLRRFREEDAEDFFEVCRKDEVTRFLTYNSHQSIDDTRGIIALWISEYERQDAYNWAIELDGRVVGSIGAVKSSDEMSSCTLGWQIDSSLWNKGYMTEAAKAVVAYLQEVGFVRISAYHDVLNPASGRVMQKAGMTFEGTLRRNLLRKDGTLGDMSVYAVIAEG